MIEIAILIAIIAAAVILCRLHDELPKPYRSRECMGRDWRRAFPNASKRDIRRFLDVFVDAFAFRERNRLKFSPSDRLMEVYKTLYPHRWMPDQLEHVTLAQGLEDEFEKEFPEELMEEDVTLGVLFSTMTGNANVDLGHISNSAAAL